MKTKGLRNLATIQTIRNKARPSSRAEMAAQIARLEHERFRVERELAIFEEKKVNALESLARTKAQIDQLSRALYDVGESTDEAAAGTSEQTAQSNKETNKGSKKVRTVTLGY